MKRALASLCIALLALSSVSAKEVRVVFGMAKYAIRISDKCGISIFDYVA